MPSSDEPRQSPPSQADGVNFGSGLPIGKLDPVSEAQFLRSFLQPSDDDFWEESSMKSVRLRLRVYSLKPSLSLI